MFFENNNNKKVAIQHLKVTPHFKFTMEAWRKWSEDKIESKMTKCSTLFYSCFG